MSGMARAFPVLGRRLLSWAYALPAPPAARSNVEMGVRAGVHFARDDAAFMAAGIAFYGILSFFPLVLAIIAIGGYVVGEEYAESQAFGFLRDQFPAFADSTYLRENIEAVVGARGALSALAILVLFWSGRAVFGAIHRAVNRAWEATKAPPYWRQQLKLLAIAVGVGALFVLSVSLTTAGSVLAARTQEAAGGLPVRAAWNMVVSVLPFLASTVFYLLVFRLVPEPGVRWRDVWPPAVIAGALFESSKAVFLWYLRSYAGLDRVYGNVSAIVALLLWMYLASLILVLGAEIAAELARSRATRGFSLVRGWRPVRGGLAPAGAGRPAVTSGSR